MHIGILGTGIVGQTLGLRLIQLGHQVMLGTRDPAQLGSGGGEMVIHSTWVKDGCF